MHRHRRCHQYRQAYTGLHGFDVPELVKEAGAEDRFAGALKAAQIAMRDLPEPARQYLMPFGLKSRFLFKMDFAEVEYISRVRSAVKGHFSYRKVAWDMKQRVEEIETGTRSADRRYAAVDRRSTEAMKRTRHIAAGHFRAPFRTNPAHASASHRPLRPRISAIGNPAFLEACHTHDYAKASHFLDLRRMPLADRAKNSLEITKQLEDLLDDIPFDIAAVSRARKAISRKKTSPISSNTSPRSKVDGKILDLQLQRVELKPA